MSLPARASVLLSTILFATSLVATSACGPGETGSSGTTTGTDSGSGGSGGTTSATGGNTSTGGQTTSGGTAGAGGTTTSSGGAGPSFEVSVITDRHRFIPNAMFGGWGPHLGHLVRATAGETSSLYWVDDVCSQAGGPAPICDVNHDTAIGIFRKDGATWTDLGETVLPGTVQQNTGSFAVGGSLETYGIDVLGHVVQRCTFDAVTQARSCGALPFTLGGSANYIGAAVSPQGYRLVWWTDVQDGGGGMFDFIVDYGDGWNGPRTGDIGGYNDSSYIHVGFRADTTQFTMHTQLVSGLAPNWGYLGAVGEGDSAVAAPVTWSNALTPADAADPIESTDDIAIDPVTGDTHLFARSHNGAAVYYFRPKGGAWSSALFTIPGAFRLRFSTSPVGLAIVYGIFGQGLLYRLSPAGAGAAGTPVDWAALAEHVVPLPAGYENVEAIYPESSVYQTTAVPGIAVAVVGEAAQNEALFVGIQP